MSMARIRRLEQARQSTRPAHGMGFVFDEAKPRHEALAELEQFRQEVNDKERQGFKVTSIVWGPSDVPSERGGFVIRWSGLL